MKYCATTVALPHLDMRGQAELLARLGYDGVELRVRRVSDEQRRAGKPSNWGYHVNDLTPENFKEKAPEVRRILDEYGLELAGIASNAPCTDLEQVRLLIEGAAEAGAPFIRVGAAAGFPADGRVNYREVWGETIAGYARVTALARGSGVKVALEIHGGTIHPSASLAMRIVEQFDPAEVGVIYDPQNMVRDGFETTALAIQLLGPYLLHCHVGGHRPKPGPVDEETGTVNWQWERCRLSEGLYDYRVLIRELKKIGFEGFISVEDFGDVPAEEKLADAITYLRRVEERVQV